MDMNTIEWGDSERTPVERWSRVMGYMRPMADYNIGKKQEAKDRVCFKESIAMRTVVGAA